VSHFFVWQWVAAGDVGFIVDTAGCSQAKQQRLPLSDRKLK
jgi:hypothetical protein